MIIKLIILIYNIFLYIFLFIIIDETRHEENNKIM